MEQAIRTLLAGIHEQSSPQVLWRMQYQLRAPSQPAAVEVKGGLIGLPELSNDLVLDDSTLDSVRHAWRTITNGDEDMFMKFERRDAEQDDE